MVGAGLPRPYHLFFMDINIELKKFIYDCAKKAYHGVDIKPEDVMLEAPKASEHGDISTNIAMKLCKSLTLPPVQVAENIAASMHSNIINTKLSGKIAKVSVKNPGFINFFLTNVVLYSTLEKIIKEDFEYGSCDLGKKQKIQIEFVSANPTGPLSVAHGRQAAVGDILANILRFAGFKVTKEYFINDEGRQMEMLGESIRQRYLELLGEPFLFPQNGYKGKYIYDIAQTVIDKHADKYVKESSDTKKFFKDYGCGFILNIIKEELNDFGVKFEVWTSQAKIAGHKKIETALKLLEKKGFLYKQEDALWFKSTAFGDDKDRVVIKSDGLYTYLAPDIAYHKDKFKRGFKKVINIWGPDHHGYIPRLRAAVRAMGYPEESLDVLIVQLATLWRGKEQVPMSTRSGEFITLRQVMNDVGKDAARFFFVARKISSHLDFDIELAKSRSQENPVYYIQYAHARIFNILEHAKKSGYGAPSKADFKLLIEQQEIDLLKALAEFPGIIVTCAQTLEPCGLVAYLQNLANKFHSFYDKQRVVTENRELTAARLVLIAAAKTVLATGLKLLGVSAPEKM